MEDAKKIEPVVAAFRIEEPGNTAVSSLEPADAQSATLSAAEPQKVCELRSGHTLRVGRSNTNDFPVNNSNVSRFHAVFSASASGVVLSDLSSMNGTFVNGYRITTPVDISSGDVVAIGDTKFHVKLTLGESSDGDPSHGRTQTAQLKAVVVTVLVVDVCGYTKLSEALPPNDVANMMHHWFQVVSDIVNEYGGEVDKYIGDCVMALWRETASHAGESAKKAIEAGKKIKAVTEKLSTDGQWEHHERYPWTCRVALNTGEALMGMVGGGGRRDFTVLGDTVNVAFRLEGVAGKLSTDFILSAGTAEFVKDAFPLKSLGKVNLEGRSGEVGVFTLEDN